MSEAAAITQSDLLELVQTQLNEEDALAPEVSLDSLTGWDSMGILLLMAEFDERLGLTLTEDDIGDLATVQDIVDFVEKHGKLLA